MPAAAHVETPVTHSSAMGGLLAGVVIGAVIGVAVVASGGTAALVIAGAAATGASLGGMAGKFLGGLVTSEVGKITTGSPNVFIHRKAAAFCSSEAVCSKHPGPGAMVAQGSSTVAINGLPAARTGDKGKCGFAIGKGSPRVNIGGAPYACADVESEVPWWADAGLMVLGLAGGGALLRAAGHGMAAIGARLGGSMLGGWAGSEGGGYVGGKVFGEGSTGQSVMAFGGGLVGGGLGFKGGAKLDAYPRMNPFNYRPYAEPGTLGANGGNVRFRYVGPTEGGAPPSGAVPQYRTPHRPLSAAERKQIQSRVDSRTATRAEYERMEWDRRFNNRRTRGVSRYWSEERRTLRSGQPGTRDWTPEQRADILAGRVPKHDGVPIEGHHRYNALDHPQLADDPRNIYPATKNEHLYRWHGGNFQNDTYGTPLNRGYPEDF